MAKKIDKSGDYIHVDMLVYRNNKKKINQKELDKFVDDFIELVEKKKMSCGGGCSLKNGKED
jgi:hypothetical protein